MADITTSSHAATTGKTSGLSDTAGAWLIALGIIGTATASGLLFGLAGLSMVALVMVPIVYICLVLITFGK
jgi:hypothetical protein